jgi:hypothetical protein
MVTEIELFETPDLTPLEFSLWGWMKNEIYKIDTRGDLLARIFYAAARILKSEN